MWVGAYGFGGIWGVYWIRLHVLDGQKLGRNWKMPCKIQFYLTGYKIPSDKIKIFELLSNHLLYLGFQTNFNIEVHL
jgi:hypothetical protein